MPAFKPSRSSSGGLVYSTDTGRMCPTCRHALAACVCRNKPAGPVGDGRVRVGRETKGRGGKCVTIVRGLPITPTELEAVGKQLRAACGSGGTTKDGVLEIQGDHVERVMAWLQQQGHQPKRTGG